MTKNQNNGLERGINFIRSKGATINFFTEAVPEQDKPHDFKRFLEGALADGRSGAGSSLRLRKTGKKGELLKNKYSSGQIFPERDYLAAGGQGWVIGAKLNLDEPEIFLSLLEHITAMEIAEQRANGSKNVLNHAFDYLKEARKKIIKDYENKKPRRIREDALSKFREKYFADCGPFNMNKFFENVVAKVEKTPHSDSRKTFTRDSIIYGMIHPNILPVIYRGITANDHLVTILPRIDKKKSLLSRREMMDFGKKYSIDDFLDAAIQFCKGFSYAHERGIIHRDVKAENLIVTELENGKVWGLITDFGIATFEGKEDYGISETLEGTIKGTLGYISPEQAFGSGIDERTDIYSLGASFYEMVTGLSFRQTADILTPRQKLAQIKSIITDPDVYENPQGITFFSDNSDSIIDYEIQRNKNSYNGFFGKRKEKKLRKFRQRQLLGIELVLAKMLVTYESKDLKETMSPGEQREHIKKALKSRYTSMDQIISDLEKVRNGKLPLKPGSKEDYRNVVFRTYKKPESMLKKALKTGAGISIAVAGAGAVAYGLNKCGVDFGPVQPYFDSAKEVINNLFSY